MMYTHRLVSLAAHECKKQDVGPLEVVQLLDAWGYAYDQVRSGQRFPTVGMVKRVAKTIEPQAARDYRLTPVTFLSGGSAAAADTIPEAMDRLVVHFSLDFDGNDVELVDQWIKAFLDIHPFADGNGRTAWVLRHWLLNSFNRPEPLPEYFN